MRRAAVQPTWALGCDAAVWGSRWAQPAQPRWEEAEAVTHLPELTRAKGDADPDALAWAGVLSRRRLPPAEPRWRRLVAGRPVSAVTTHVLAGCCDRVAQQAVPAVLR